jgi:hypothetical protein
MWAHKITEGGACAETLKGQSCQIRMKQKRSCWKGLGEVSAKSLQWKI